jgi:hypothetical protein
VLLHLLLWLGTQLYEGQRKLLPVLLLYCGCISTAAAAVQVCPAIVQLHNTVTCSSIKRGECVA